MYLHRPWIVGTKPAGLRYDATREAQHAFLFEAGVERVLRGLDSVGGIPGHTRAPGHALLADPEAQKRFLGVEPLPDAA